MDNAGVYVLLSLTLFFGNAVTQNNNECFTPNDLNGVCINIKTCPLLRSLLQNGITNDTVKSFIRNSSCGFEGRVPKVCCPLDIESISTSTIKNYQMITTHKTVNFASSGYETVSSTKLPSQNTCGRNNQTSKRILVPITELGTWPWIAAIGYTNILNETTDYLWLCSGTLISDRYVLTAAHCTDIPHRKIEVAHLGDYDLDPEVIDGATPIDVPIEYVIPHEQYNPKVYTNDIALLKLKQIISFTNLIQPICLPIFSGIRNDMLIKRVPYVAGWGSRSSFPKHNYTLLLEMQLPVISNEICKRAFINNDTVIDDRVLCTGYLMGGKEVCLGDSGGPLMLPAGKIQYYLVGIESNRFRCGETGFPGVYTRVTHFVDWIVQTMNKN